MTKAQKKDILKEVKKMGIVDIDAHPINEDTIKLAIELTKKHGPEIYERLEKRRKEQLI